MSTGTGVRALFRPFQAWRARPTQEVLDALHAHAGLMISSAVRVLGCLSDAEDVAQDVAEKLLRSPPGEVRHWPAYLKTLAVNKAIDRLRGKRQAVETELISDSPDPEQHAMERQRARALREAIAGLSERDAALFSLAHFADLSHNEIGHQLGMTANAVGVALHRVRQRLAERLRTRLDINESGDRS